MNRIFSWTKNTTKNITTNKTAITVARLFAGIPKILSII